MFDDLLFALTFVAAIGCGLVAGIFFAFSTFVMKALARIPPGDGRSKYIPRPVWINPILRLG